LIRLFVALLILTALAGGGCPPGNTPADASGIPNAAALSSKRCTTLGRLIGAEDALLVCDPAGKTIVGIHADKMLMPASTLKVLTALIARHYLGPAFRFKTEVYIDSRKNLKIKGYGDPLLISEELRKIAGAVAGRIHKFNDLIVDDSYFGAVTIPGVTDTLNPYDAPSGALAVNFNTVNFRRAGNRVSSAEPQTPLVPFILDRIRHSGLQTERVVLSAENDEATLYAGHLFRRFLTDAGIRSTGGVKTGAVRPGRDRLVYRHTSAFTLDQVIRRLLMYSNNYMANQLLIAAGIAVYGPPGSLEKGLSAADTYIRKVLGITAVHMAEGSGISRENRISAACMMKVLEAFRPYHALMRETDGAYFKTGTLSGVSTRAGYVRNGTGEDLCPFVLMVNTPGRHADPVMSQLIPMMRIGGF